MRARLAEAQQRIAALEQELLKTNDGVLSLNQELEEKREALEQAIQTKDRFIRSLSHECVGEAAPIIMLARTMLDRTEGDLTPEQEKHVSLILQAAEDIHAYLQDLLALARLQSTNEIAVKASTFPVSELFSGLYGLMSPKVGTKEVVLVFEPCDLPDLCTDRAKVWQVLRNLISNAVKFTGQGEVRVSARLSDDGQRVAFAVSDTGRGIAPEDRERIFDEFTQAARASGGRTGAGIGLSLSRRLAGLLGGDLTVESEPGVGSTFRLIIPIYHTAADCPRGAGQRSEDKHGQTQGHHPQPG